MRNALVESGKFKSLADLKGLKLQFQRRRVGEQSILNEALKRGGLGWNDCERTFLGISEQVAAFRNGGLDASITSEPLISIMAKQGLTTRLRPWVVSIQTSRRRWSATALNSSPSVPRSAGAS